MNGIRAVERKGFLDWLRQESPDMLCVQETKASPDQLSSALREPVDGNGSRYHSYWMSAKRKGYSGTAIFSREEPLAVRNFGLPEFDDEGRVTQADYTDFSLISAYFPNSQDTLARLPYKLAFCQAMLSYCNQLIAEGRHIVLCGDYNIAHTRIDIARPDENEGHSGFLPEERAWMDEWLAAGYADTFRRLHPDERDKYSWWSYRGGARERNVGWRIDYCCVDEAFMPRVQAAVIHPQVYGSDHCPIEVCIL